MASLQQFCLDGTNFTGNDLRRLILSLGLKTTEFSQQCSVAPRTLIRYCDYQDSAIPEESINNINGFIQGLPERTVLPIPLKGRRNNTIISFMQADHEALSGFYSLDSVDWARFLNYQDVSRWFKGERFVDNPKTVRILGILTHLTQSFARQGLTLADEQPQNVRRILLSSKANSLEQYYDEKKSSLPDWRQCLENSILKRPPSITGFELARMRLSEGASQADYSKILTPCIQKNMGGLALGRLEGFDNEPIDFSTVQDGYFMQDVLCQRFDTTLVLPIPIRGRQKSGLNTFTQQEINNLVQFFDLTTKQLALLCGVTTEAARIWRSRQRTITDITPLRTLGVLELLRQTFENYKLSLYQDPDNLDPLRNLNLEAKEGLNGTLAFFRESVRGCQTPDALWDFIKYWPHNDMPLPRQQRIFSQANKTANNTSDRYLLFKEELTINKTTASLSQDTLDAINQIFETEAFRRKKAPIIRAHKPYIQDDSIKSFFIKKPINKYIFRDILEALMAAGVVSLEEGTTLEDMLDIPANNNGPYVLDQQSFVMGKRGVSLSDDAARYIRETLIEKGLSNIEISRTVGMHKATISRTLNATPRDRSTLSIILQHFIIIGVVSLEQGQTLDTLLEKKPEPSYDIPNAAQDITEGCMGSSGQSLPAAQALVAAQVEALVRS